MDILEQEKGLTKSTPRAIPEKSEREGGEDGD
jgi:hypothetical protein